MIAGKSLQSIHHSLSESDFNERKPLTSDVMKPNETCENRSCDLKKNRNTLNDGNSDEFLNNLSEQKQETNMNFGKVSSDVEESNSLENWACSGLADKNYSNCQNCVLLIPDENGRDLELQLKMADDQSDLNAQVCYAENRQDFNIVENRRDSQERKRSEKEIRDVSIFCPSTSPVSKLMSMCSEVTAIPSKKIQQLCCEHKNCSPNFSSDNVKNNYGQNYNASPQKSERDAPEVNIEVLAKECIPTIDEHNNRLRNHVIIVDDTDAQDSSFYECLSKKSQAIKLLEQKHFVEALEEFEDVIKFSLSLGVQERHHLIKESRHHIDSIRYITDLMNEADIIYGKGVQYDHNAEYRKALQAFKTSLDIKISIFGIASSPHTFSISETLHHYGVVLWKMGDYEGSLTELLKAINLNAGIRKRTKEIQRSYAEISISIGNSYLAQGDFTRAMTFFKKAVSIHKEINRRHDHPDVAFSIICMGKAYNQKGRLKRAMKCYREGLRIQSLFHQMEDVNIAATLNYMGVLHEKLEEFVSAMACYEAALLTFRSILGDHHVDVAVTLLNIGQVYRLSMEYEKAMAYCNEALSIFVKVLGHLHRNVASTIHNIGLLHLEIGEHTKALSNLSKALKIQQQVLGTHEDVAITLDSLGELFEKHGKYEKALKMYSKAVKVRQSALGKDHLHTGICLHRLGNFYKDKIQHQHTAMELYIETLHIYRVNLMKENDKRMSSLVKSIDEIRSKNQ